MLLDILGKKRNVGKFEIGRNLLDTFAGVLQLVYDMLNGILLIQLRSILPTNALDNA